MKKERTNKNVKIRGNGEGTIYFSEALNKYVAQYVEPSTGKRKTLTQRKNEEKKEFKDRFTKGSTYARDIDTLKQIEKCCPDFINKSIQNVSLFDIQKSKEKMNKYAKSGIDRM